MRLVHLSGYGGPYAGSFIPMLRAVMRAAADRGWNRELVFSPAARGRPWLEELRQDGIPFEVVASSSRAELTRLVTSLLDRGGGPTILHCHFTTFDVPCVRSARRSDGAAVIWHVHSPHGSSLALCARNIFKYGLLGRGVERILCVSEDLVDVVTARGAPAGRVEYVPNAIDADRFPPAARAEREQARRELQLPAGHSVLVHFGWDWERKGGAVFCEAVARLRASGHDVVGLTVAHPEQAVPARTRHGLSAQALRVCEPRDDVRTFYAAADVFVAPSRAEGTPYAVLEALSSGAAVVASEIPGHVEIGRSVSACALAPLEPGAIADAAAALIDRPAELIDSEARAGHDWVRRERGLAAWTEALMQRYEAALSGAPA